MNARFRFVYLLFLLLIAPASSAGIVTLLDQNAWETALAGSGWQQANFDGPRHDFTADSVNPVDGITIRLRGGVGDPGPTGLTGGGFLRGELDNSGADVLALEFSFPSTLGLGLFGLQNDSVSSPDKLDLAEIALGVGGSSWILADLLGAAKGSAPFLGFVSDVPFSSLELFHAGAISDVTRSSENFYLDGLVTTQAVPEPTPLALLIPGLLMLPRFRRAIFRVLANQVAKLKGTMMLTILLAAASLAGCATQWVPRDGSPADASLLDAARLDCQIDDKLYQLSHASNITEAIIFNLEDEKAKLGFEQAFENRESNTHAEIEACMFSQGFVRGG